MGGNEYGPKIERVGLKVAIKNFGLHKNFEGVLKALRESKTHKDRVPTDYE